MKKILTGILLLFFISWSSYAQVSCNTFVKQLYRVGNMEPRIFKSPNMTDYYVTTFNNKATYITKIDATGNLLSTQRLNFIGDAGAITDMIVDNFDGTLAGIVRGRNYNIMFKYDFNTSSFQWLKQYRSNYIFHNIHQTNINTYVVTGNILGGQTTIFDVDRNTGMIATFQNASLEGEFLSTWDGNDIYGACRYYFNSNSLFLSSLFKFDTAGNNIWRNTYITYPATATTPARIYPVAPIVDGAGLLQLSSGDDVGFNSYLTGPTKAWLLKTDLNGWLAWTHQINIPGYTQLNVKKIINTATGYYLLIDSYNGSIVDYFFVVKTDKNGVVQWANRYGISGVNTVVSGVEGNGFLYLTALSDSYTSGSNPLLLKLDAQGRTGEADCGFIQRVEAYETPYANVEEARPTDINPTNYSNSDLGARVANVRATEETFCCGTLPPPQPCKTFVKELYQVGNIQPRIFKDASATNYYVTSFDNQATYITKMDAAGNLLNTQQLNFNGDAGAITDMIVDNFDGTLAGIVKGSNYNIMFKYDFNTSSFQWLKQYRSNYIFHNIHQTNINTYVVTGNILGGQTTIFDVDRNTGMIATFQNASLGGEFYSAWDGNDIYGACRYYFNSNSLFLSSLFKFDTAGNNIWRNTYITNPATATTPARIYPVAPIVDGADLLQLSSGDDVGFNSYLTGPTKAWLLKTDLNGWLAWTHQINIPGYTQLNVKKIINTATGYYLLIDSYNGSIVDYFFVVKTDKNGVVQWANRYGISGVNTVVSGVEDNGFLYLTALSDSYTSGSNPLLLKLDAQGRTGEADCGFIQRVEAYETPYANVEEARPTDINPTNYSNSDLGANVASVTATEETFCCGTQPQCTTLTGSLSNGVLAFYPFGNGSLADLSGNGNNLSNSTGAFPTPDRDNNRACAYRFSNTDFLTTTASAFLDGLTTSPFSISLWYQPIGTRSGGNYELLVGRGSTGLHCPDTWSEWSVGLYDCRKAVVGFDQYSHWQASPTGMGCEADMAAISNTWHHLAFVYDGSSYKLYIDGTLHSSSSGPCGPMSANLGPLMLGVDYNGDLDDIVIYNRSISAAEVVALRSLNGSCCDDTISFSKIPDTFKAQSTTKPDNVAGITLYPNPSDGRVSVLANNNIRSIAVYSSTGVLTGTYTFNAKEVSLNIEHLASGFYYLKIVTEAGSSVEKLIKN